MTTTTHAPPMADTTKLTLHFIRSLQEVLSTMASTQVTVGKPTKKSDPIPTFDVSGIIGFSGDFIGSMVLSFRRSTALSIVKAFSGLDCAAESPDFADAIGELANMIAGSAKKAFGGTNISLPTVIIGSGHIIARMQDVPCIVIPCDSPGGAFAVEINVKSAAKSPAPNPA